MPRLSTPPSSTGSGEDDSHDGFIGMTAEQSDWEREADGSDVAESPKPIKVNSELLGGEFLELDHMDEVSNGLPRKKATVTSASQTQGVKRKPGRPPKSAVKLQGSATDSGNNAKAQRRSGRIVAQAKTQTVKDPTKSEGRLKRTRQQKHVPGRNAVRAGKEKEFEVETIVDTHIDAATSETQYLVKWKGYPSKDNTWEPEGNLDNCKGAIKKFETKKKEAAKKSTVKKRRTTKN